MGRTRTITEHERIRRLLGMAVVDLARRTGFSHGYVSMVDGGRIRASARYRAAVATVLGVPELVIFPGEDAE